MKLEHINPKGYVVNKCDKCGGIRAKNKAWAFETTLLCEECAIRNHFADYITWYARKQTKT